jgi:hypothetical protein
VSRANAPYDRLETFRENLEHRAGGWSWSRGEEKLLDVYCEVRAELGAACRGSPATSHSG